MFALWIVRLLIHYNFAEGNVLPGQVIVAQHAAFGLTCLSTVVDETGAFTSLLSSHFIHDDLVLKISAKLQKLSPEIHITSNICGQFFLTPNDIRLNLRKVFPIEARQQFQVFDDNDLSITVQRLIETSIIRIGRVNACDHIVVHD
jgi:hypothetical protein